MALMPEREVRAELDRAKVLLADYKEKDLRDRGRIDIALQWRTVIYRTEQAIRDLEWVLGDDYRSPTEGIS